MVRGLLVTALLLAVGCGRSQFAEIDAGGDAVGDAGDAPTSGVIRVQSGTTIIGTGSTVALASIAQVDPAHAFLVFTASVDSVDPGSGDVAGQLGAVQLQFSRGGPGNPATVVWYVVEWPLMTVQRGNVLHPGPGITSFTQPIVPVNLGESFPMLSVYNGGTGYDEDDFVAVHFVASNQLFFEVGAPTGGSNMPDRIEWQVVSIPGAKVQSGRSSLATGMASTTPSLTTTVDPAHAMLVHSWFTSFDVAQIGANMLTGSLQASTVTLSRDPATTTGDLTDDWFVIEHPSLNVQHGTTLLTQPTIGIEEAIQPVDRARAFPLVPGRYMQTPFAGSDPNDQIGVAAPHVFLTDPTIGDHIHIGRDSTLDAAQATWSVIELPASM
ncbi:MAG TPA: hypothetical protein VL326_18975 [Kofleriaceae bacterium]|nr:hypothetical protein [Kofleriaceae bacterium]